MKAFQLVPYSLPAITWAAGGSATHTLRDVPKSLFGRICHVHSITWEVDVDPTFTTAPTVIGLNNVVSDLQIFDGSFNRFSGGGFNLLRVFEALENGKLSHPEPDTNSASTNNFYFARTWHCGPRHLAGAPSDFLYPGAALENGEIKYRFGALTDISADTTAATVAIRAIVWLAVLDELRIPPALERMAYTAGAADLNLTGRAMYLYMAMLNSASVDAITAGDFGAMTVDTGAGQLISAIDAEELGRAYHSQMDSGQFTVVQGEQRASTDDNPVIKNGGTPTALVAATAAIQPLVWCPPGTRLSKVPAVADSVCRVRWNGSQASGAIAATRVLEQSQTAMATVAARALNRLGLRDRGTKVKTLSKAPYTGPRPDFMPYAVKVG